MPPVESDSSPQHMNAKPPIPQGDLGLPTLKVGVNELPEGTFEVALTKLVRDPSERKAARKAGNFAIDGGAGQVRVVRAKTPAAP